MPKSLTLVFLFISLSVKANFLDHFVSQVDKVELNKKIYQEKKFWKEQVHDTFWNRLAILSISSDEFCLLYRTLPSRKTKKDSLMLVKKKKGISCIEEIENPIWQEKDIDQVKTEWESEKIYISFLKGAQYQVYHLKLLSKIYSEYGINFIGTFKEDKSVDFTSPCLQLNKNCKPISPSKCERCPFGVIGQYVKKSCAGQSLYCRRDKTCGISEHEACQMSKETSTGCEARKESYFCQANLNMVCEKGRMVCF